VRDSPAIDVLAASLDDTLALVDDFEPSAAEERAGAVRVFFFSRTSRDSALAALKAAGHDAAPLDVPDEDWARRSQEGLPAVTIGGITILPDADHAPPGVAAALVLVIPPSMGFGTGHHPTTRLCLEALQARPLQDRTLLDAGTGSGVLALAAARLGAARAVGIDVDEDAVRCARENLARNPEAAPRAAFELRDLASEADMAAIPPADVVVANLTGALLRRSAPALLRAAGPGALLMLSGILAAERDEVLQAFEAGASLEGERSDQGWALLILKKL
jgi:ribosomal protein L11 methyltransferase